MPIGEGIKVLANGPKVPEADLAEALELVLAFARTIAHDDEFVAESLAPMKNWDDVRYYLAVARNGSVSAAAAELGVSHATVLRRIDQLEKELRVKLFKRLQRGYELDEAGHALLSGAIDIEIEMRRMKALAEGQGEAIAGQLRVTHPQVGGAFDIYPIYEQFIRRYPGISLDIQPGAYNVNLNQQEADVAILQGQPPSDLLVGRKVGSAIYSAYVSTGYLANFDSPPQMAEVDWVVPGKSLLRRSGNPDNAWDQLYQQVETPKVVMQSSSYPDIVAAMRAGLGASMVSHVVGKSSQELVRLPNCSISHAVDVWVLIPRDLRTVSRVRHFVEFISVRLKDMLRGTT